MCIYVQKNPVIAPVMTKSQTTYTNALGQYGKACKVYIIFSNVSSSSGNFKLT